MGTRRHQGAYDKIRSKDPALKLIRGGALPDTYETFFGLLDFVDDDIINLRAAKALLGTPLPSPVELSETTPTMPLTLTSTDLGQPIVNFGSHPKIRVVLDAGDGVLNSELTGFTTGVIPTAGVPTSIVIDDGSGAALTYNIIVIISAE